MFDLEACAENFGGVAACHLPPDSEWHQGGMGEVVEGEEVPDAEVYGTLPVYGGDSPDGIEEPGDGESGGSTPVLAPPPSFPQNAEEWQTASVWLQSPGVELTYGPWPVRKFILRDAEKSPHYGMAKCVRSLETLEKEYMVLVTRPEGQPYREAFVTWDMLLGLSLESVLDELAALYG
jgi:hypothetical protein